MNMLRVMVVDDEAHVRVVLRELVKSIPAEVVGELDNGLEVTTTFGILQPDLVLLDINMPYKTGDAVVTELKQSYPDARIIIMTGIEDSETIGQCVDSGASGYIRKDLSFAEMRERLLLILENE
jgi:two-component system, chemotaxis family, chemotaxis protein CheY